LFQSTIDKLHTQKLHVSGDANDETAGDIRSKLIGVCINNAY